MRTLQRPSGDRLQCRQSGPRELFLVPQLGAGEQIASRDTSGFPRASEHNGVVSSTTHAKPTHTTTTLTPVERAAVTTLMRTHGIRRAHEILGVARHAMERAAGGLTVQRGTAALVRAALARTECATSEVPRCLP
jgi:hypothetical protein